LSKPPAPAPYTALLVDEFALLRAWQGGDTESGSQLLRRYAETLYHFFLTKTDPTNAEELTQATFEACTRHREHIQEAGSIRAYLFGIARKKVLQHRDEWRRRGARQDALEHSVVASLTSPSVAVARSQQQQLVLQALVRLPLDFQIAVELHYWEDMSVSEIARVLEVAPGTVKSRLFRARELLRDAIVELASHADLAQATVQGLDRWIASLQRAPGSGSGDAH
jgi:RNA polymerase sigma-70 factor (ECF subfamily)